LIGEDGIGTTEIWFKFWLEPGDLDGQIRLRMNHGILQLKTSQGLPRIGASGQQFFNSTAW
jgi:hypothetical protein